MIHCFFWEFKSFFILSHSCFYCCINTLSRFCHCLLLLSVFFFMALRFVNTSTGVYRVLEGLPVPERFY